MTYFEILVQIAITSIILFVVRYNENRVKKLFYGGAEDKEAFLRKQITELQSNLIDTEEGFKLSIAQMKSEYEGEITVLRRYVDNLLEQVANLRRQVEYFDYTEPELLLVCGDSKFCDEDENSLRKSGIRYIRLTGANFITFTEEMRRRRSIGNPYKFIHISAHAGADGLLLSGRVLTAFELSKIINQASVVVLAGCSDVRISDRLLGSIEVVISLREETESTLLEEFSYHFWKGIKEGKGPRLSYNEAMELLPELRPQIDYREVHR